MWAVLGDIEFELTYHPGRQDERSGADYVQHALLQGKPRAEWVGDRLDELTLELTLHMLLGDPEAQIRRLKAAKSAHEPLPYVLGSGDYRGIYLLTEVAVSTRKTSAQGRLVSATVSISLLEYSGKYTKPLPKPRALVSNLAADPLARIGGATSPLVTPTQKALGLAKLAENGLRAGVEAFGFVKTLRENPAAMLAQAPRLLGLTGQVLQPLQEFQLAAELMKDGADLVQLGISVASEVQLAQGALNSPRPEAIISQVDYATRRMEAAQDRLAGASTRLAGLAVDVISRRA